MGTVRLCVQCLAPIPGARLAAIPGAQRCVRCAGTHYVRPASPSFPGGNWSLLAEATEAPIQRLAEPERHAQERAEGSMYRQIEGLEEIDEPTTPFSSQRDHAI